MKLTIIRAIMGIIPGIGFPFLMAIMFDYVQVKYWRYVIPVIMLLHSCLVWTLIFSGLFSY